MREHYIFVNIFANICIWYAPIFANAHWCTSEESGAWPTLEPTVTPLGLSRFLLSKKMPKFNAQNHPKCNINMLIRNFTSSLGLLTPTHPQFRTLSFTFSRFRTPFWMWHWKHPLRFGADRWKWENDPCFQTSPFCNQLVLKTLPSSFPMIPLKMANL